MDKIEKNNRKYVGYYLLAVIVFALFYGVYLIIQPKEIPQVTEVKIEECLDTKFGLSMMQTPFEKQKTCALLTLENAKPIEITKTTIGDNQLSDIEAFAKGDFESSGNYQSDPLKTTLKQCFDSATCNAATSACLNDVEESLQRKIRSLVLLQIEQEKQMSYIAHDVNPDLFTEELKEDWQNWYVSTTNENSNKAKECEIEVTKGFGGSGWYEAMPMCYIKYDANEILWLLKQKEERKQFFEEQWIEMQKDVNTVL
jgi:hypothetical protein